MNEPTTLAESVNRLHSWAKFSCIRTQLDLLAIFARLERVERDRTALLAAMKEVSTDLEWKIYLAGCVDEAASP